MDSRILSQRTRWKRLVLITISGIASQAIAGCSGHDSWKAKTYPTSGTMTINGQPAENVFVLLHSTGDPVDKRNSKPYAVVDSSGRFRFSTYEPSDGVPVGEFAFVFYMPSDPTDTSPDRLGGVFANPKKPYMTVSISKGTNTLPPIELTNVKVLPAKQSVDLFLKPPSKKPRK